MDLEIELKLLATPSAQQDILSWLTQSQLNYTVLAQKQLRNDYFETPQRTLRKHDVGLRIRGHNGEYEQTVKTKGRVIAGMHQRPEYNVSLPSPVLQLALFDEDIWPQSIDLRVLEDDLYLMFSTDFMRHTYLITLGSGTQVELVFDQGAISANGRTVDICEIELELKQGEPSELFELAQQLVDITPLRVGLHSKAARGYRLADNLAEPTYTPAPYFSVSLECSPIQHGVSMLEQALEVWQQGEAAFYQSQRVNDWRNMRAGIILVQEILAIYQHAFESQAIIADSGSAGLLASSVVQTLQVKLDTLSVQYQEADLMLDAMHLHTSDFLTQHKAPYHGQVNCKLAEFNKTANVLTRLRSVLAKPHSMHVQLSLGALCLTATSENAIRKDSPARQDDAAKKVTMPQLIHDTMSAKDIGLPSKRNKLAACKVIWGALDAINAYDAHQGSSNPWGVLRGEDDKSMRDALNILLERHLLSVEPNVKAELTAWCANN
ncbi:inorganic triphosphatase [Paraglaciecola sp. T6c]|uniref:CYTH domain-containing protein n=1 Tax=Pseudoalteromonas atlantica (strain T6c / ATCC BAA-1087) TaxID=3042615 RepID=UPI0002F249D3|nr:CYTH domain-containing protein [Paraglaciecola sp. T6c]